MPSPTANGKSIEHRYDFVYFFDITDGNPNGDPDAGNLPRIDPETGQGIVTDVCLKRKVRNFIGVTKGEQPPFEIYVKERAILNRQHDRAWQVVEPRATAKQREDLPKDEDKARQLTAWMCKNFYDVRTFGAVMSTKVNCGQVRGPIQLGLARSLHPVRGQELALTRCAVTTEEEAKEQEGGNRTMGRKFWVPYGLYRVHGYINSNLAGGDKGTGFSEGDLELFKQALDRMFELDKSAARANMRPVACIAFKHESLLGNARADKLFARVRCTPKPGVQPLPGDVGNNEEGRPPRSFGDYELRVDESDMPQGDHNRAMDQLGVDEDVSPYEPPNGAMTRNLSERDAALLNSDPRLAEIVHRLAEAYRPERIYAEAVPL